MNWLTKIKILGDKIKRNLQKKFPTKEEIANSDWTSCCKGPVLKKDLEENLWVCNSCGKHHRISCRQRFDIFFGKNSYDNVDDNSDGEYVPNRADVEEYNKEMDHYAKVLGQPFTPVKKLWEEEVKIVDGKKTKYIYLPVW